MKTSVRFSLLLLLSVTIICCKHSTSSREKDLSIYGSWQWIKTQGAETGAVHTPESSGNTAKVIFQESGTAQFYRNDTLLDQILFTLSKTNILADGKEVYLIHWSSKEYMSNQYIFFHGNDTLHLTELGTDAFHNYYVRIRK